MFQSGRHRQVSPQRDVRKLEADLPVGPALLEAVLQATSGYVSGIGAFSQNRTSRRVNI